MDEAEPVSVTALQRDPQRYLDLVKTGHRVPITVRGQLVAYLVPAESERLSPTPTAPR